MTNRIFILTIIGILASCSEDNDNLSYNELDGEWNLITASCGFCEPLNLNVDDYVWTFDTSKETLLVENKISVQHQSLLEPGNYNLKVTDTTVTVLSVEYDYYFNEGKLILSDHPEVDGTVLEFVRENK